MLLNETRFAFRQTLILIGLVLMPLYAFVFSIGLPATGYDYIKQLQITQMSLLMLALPIIVGILSSVVMLRDTKSGMEELINVTPVTFKKRWSMRVVIPIL